MKIFRKHFQLNSTHYYLSPNDIKAKSDDEICGTVKFLLIKESLIAMYKRW